MFKESHRQMFRTHGTMMGRVFMGLLFFYSGIGILMVQGISGTVGFYESLGVPMASLLVWVVLLIKLGAGGALMLGIKVEDAAMLLLIFTVLATLFAHMSFQDINLFKNLAIIGGLLYVIAFGAGNGWKLNM